MMQQGFYWARVRAKQLCSIGDWFSALWFSGCGIRYSKRLENIESENIEAIELPLAQSIENTFYKENVGRIMFDMDCLLNECSSKGLLHITIHEDEIICANRIREDLIPQSYVIQWVFPDKIWLKSSAEELYSKKFHGTMPSCSLDDYKQIQIIIKSIHFNPKHSDLFILASDLISGSVLNKRPDAGWSLMFHLARLGYPKAAYEIASAFKENRIKHKDKNNPEMYLVWLKRAAQLCSGKAMTELYELRQGANLADLHQGFAYSCVSQRLY